MTEKSRRSIISSLRSLLGLFDQPNPAYVLGIDTSHWTGVVNWQMAWDAGIRFATIIFMDGKTRTRYAEENYRGAKDVGMMVGPYQWLRKAIEVSPGGQAREYAAMIADHPADIRPAVDYEWSPAGAAYNVDSGDLYGFVLPFADTYGKRPMIYSAYGYVSQYPLPAIYADDPFWQARYGGPPLSPVLLITHDLPLVRAFAEHVGVMQSGRLVEAGPTAQVFAQPRDPYTRRLID